MKTKPRIQYRQHLWLDVKRNVPMFGVQVKHDGKWSHLAGNGAALIFESEDECQAKVKELRKAIKSDALERKEGE